MIQLEQQQHGEFWVGGVVGWVTYQLPISNSLCGWINKKIISLLSDFIYLSYRTESHRSAVQQNLTQQDARSKRRKRGPV